MQPRLVLALALTLSASACKRDQQYSYSDAPAPAAYAEHSPSPTPRDVCEHLAMLIKAELGTVDPAVEAATIDACMVDMSKEEQLRGPSDWDLVAGCVLASQSEADIDRCDQQYPRSGQAQPGASAREEEACIYMISMLLYEAGATNEVTDAELLSMQEECLVAFAEDRKAMSSSEYEQLLECITTAETVAAMEQC